MEHPPWCLENLHCNWTIHQGVLKLRTAIAKSSMVFTKFALELQNPPRCLQTSHHKRTKHRGGNWVFFVLFQFTEMKIEVFVWIFNSSRRKFKKERDFFIHLSGNSKQREFLKSTVVEIENKVHFFYSPRRKLELKCEFYIHRGGNSNYGVFF